MDFERHQILLSQIDGSDQTFRITTDGRIENLKASIQHLGMLTPPILKPAPPKRHRKERYVIVSGFRRIDACRQMGWRHLAANCIQADTPYYLCALAAISDNFLQRELNLVETARCVALIEKAGGKRRQSYETLKTIGLEANDVMIDKLKTVDAMDDRLKRGIIEGTIAMPVALELFAMPDQHGAQLLVGLLRELRISLNRQREMLDWLQAIAHRERVTIAGILEDAAIRQYLSDETLDGPRKAKLIREVLKRLRYPEISAYEQYYADAVKEMPLQPPLRLIPPPNFESPTYSLKIDFRTVEELAHAIEKAQKLAMSTSLRALLNPIRSY